MTKVKKWAAVALVFAVIPGGDAVAREGAVPGNVRLVRAAEISRGPTTRYYLKSLSGDEQRTLAFRRLLMDRGAEKVNAFLPSVIVCEIPRTARMDQFFDDSEFLVIEESAVWPDAASGFGSELSYFRACYDMAAKIASGEVPPPGPEFFRDSVLTVPRDAILRSAPARGEGASLAPSERSIQQNSEFLVGDVFVQLVMPESTGDAENWSDKELADATRGAVAGVLAFQSRFGYAPMSFVFRSYPRARTSLEPIHHNVNTDYLWIRDVMRNLGMQDIQGDVFSMVHEFNNRGRIANGTDWVFTAFIANSENEPNHIFRGAQYTAYAFLGGPYLVMPYPAGNNPFQIDEVLLYSTVFQHEMGHVFWALDEYPSAPGDCGNHAGYLNYPNKNKILQSPDGTLSGCPEYVPCIMARAKEDIGRPVCSFTAGQMGMIDANENSIPDVFDMPPTVEFENSAVETVTTPDVTVRMKAISRAVPNRNPFQGDSIRLSYAPPLKDATITINGVGPNFITPLDGLFDEVVEDLAFNLVGISAGLTQVAVKLRNAFGSSSPPITKKIYFIGLKYALFTVRIEKNGIDISWNMIGETYNARLDLYRVEVVEGERRVIQLATDIKPSGNPTGTFVPFSFFDLDVVPGHKYRYYVEGTFTLNLAGGPRTFRSVSREIEATAMIPIRAGSVVSQASPNPSSGATTISIRVPRSFFQKDDGAGAGAAGGTQVETQTEVRVDVYDVLGRRVREVYSGRMYATVFTLSWDGTNARGEPVPSGIYFIKAAAGPATEVKKMVIVR